MASYLVFVALMAYVACSAVADPVQFNSELELLAHKEFKMLVDSFVDEKSNAHLPKKSLLGKFIYENCADPAKEVVVVPIMDIKPDPIKLPGNLTMSVEGVILSKFGAPLTAKVKVYKKILGTWIEIPCIDNVGSCTYDKACDQLAKLIKTCPPVLVKQGLTCHCPVAPVPKFSLKDYTVPVNITVPAVAKGEIKVKVEITSGATYITCVQVTMDLE